jgi:hypothetical protein
MQSKNMHVLIYDDQLEVMNLFSLYMEIIAYKVMGQVGLESLLVNPMARLLFRGAWGIFASCKLSFVDKNVTKLAILC